MTPYVFCVMGLLLAFAGINVMGAMLAMGAAVAYGVLELGYEPSLAHAANIAILVAIVEISYFFGLKLREDWPLKNPR